MSSYGLRLYKLNSSKVDRDIISNITELRLGDIEHKVLSFIINNILPNRRFFKNEEIWKPLGLNRKRVSEVLKQLSEKGFLRKITRGFYEVTEKILDFMSNIFKIYKISEGKKNKKNNINNRLIQRKVDRDISLTSGFGLRFGSGSVVGGGFCCGWLWSVSVSGYYVYLDNVRGVSVSGGYVFGDRGRKLSFIDVSLNIDVIDYAEFGVKKKVSSVSDALMPGLFVFYSNPFEQEIYFEFRPYSGVVPRDERGSLDLGSGLRLMWSFFLRVFIELFRLLRSERAPRWVRNIINMFIADECSLRTEP
jgi:predicted transcriptional regulator